MCPTGSTADRYRWKKQFLRDLLTADDDPYGPTGASIVINLAHALMTHRIEPGPCRSWLCACASAYQNDRRGRSALQVFQSTMETKFADLFFHSKIADAADQNVCLVLRSNMFFPNDRRDAQRNGSTFIQAAYFGGAGGRPAFWQERWLDTDFDPNDTDMDRLADALERALADYAKADVPLGGGSRVVFVTCRERSEWKQLRTEAQRDTLGDRIRDHVGVSWVPGDILVEIAPEPTLGELLSAGAKAAVPTAFEGWRHGYFVQRLSSAPAGSWGMTIDFALLRDPPAGLRVLEGAPEIVLDCLPLDTAHGGVKVEPVGPVREPPNVTQRLHLRYLTTALTAEQATVTLFRKAGRCL